MNTNMVAITPQPAEIIRKNMMEARGLFGDSLATMSAMNDEQPATMVDQGLSSMEKTGQTALTVFFARLAVRMEEAWDYWHRGGKYGICESCGKPIPIERLMVLPLATNCVHCAALIKA